MEGKLLYIALFAPLIGSLFSMFFATSKKRLIVGIVASILVIFSFCASFLLFMQTLTGTSIEARLFEWIAAGDVELSFGFLVDQVSATMMLVVTFVSAMVHIYAIGYMRHDPAFNRFFAYLSAFVFSMLVLVMSDNYAGLFIGWEGVGLCSWMLIGFWYHKQSASFAANEAFIMNRIADLGMLLGIFLLFWSTGSVRYGEVFSTLPTLKHSTLMWIGILLFIGAMGKSAQFPFHTWLADAMEGPTPVSALIHAATMVTAGVYLVIRSYPLYDLLPEVGYFIACLGAFVAIFAASMALVNRDLKRIIAYSTLSQLGYMFVAAGIGAYWIALFHLMTHAFFKSLLFLGAGNVMHAMNDKLDITKMGALYKPLKATAILMILASVALAGIYPFAGFFSKDKILEAAFSSGHFVLWLMLLFGAMLTAFYSFRLIMLVFFAPKNHEEHPHEAYFYMLGAMIPLAILALVSGFFEGEFHHYIKSALPLHDRMIDDITHSLLIALASFAAVSGILYAIYKYRKGGFCPSWRESFIYKLLSAQYYIPQLYERCVMSPYTRLSRIAWKLDVKIIDFVVDLIALVLYRSGEGLRVLQSGNLSKMLRLMLAGVVALLVLVIFGLRG